MFGTPKELDQMPYTRFDGPPRTIERTNNIKMLNPHIVALACPDGSIATTSLRTDDFIDKIFKEAESLRSESAPLKKEHLPSDSTATTINTQKESDWGNRFDLLGESQKQYLKEQVQLYSLIDPYLKGFLASQGLNLADIDISLPPQKSRNSGREYAPHTIYEICAQNIENRRNGINFKERVALMESWIENSLSIQTNKALELAVYCDRICDHYEKMLGPVASGQTTDLNKLNKLVLYFTEFSNDENLQQRFNNKGNITAPDGTARQTLLSFQGDKLAFEDHRAHFMLLTAGDDNKPSFCRSHKIQEGLKEDYVALKEKLGLRLQQLYQINYNDLQAWKDAFNKMITDIYREFHYEVMHARTCVGLVQQQGLQIQEDKYIAPTQVLWTLGLGNGVATLIPTQEREVAPLKEKTIFANLFRGPKEFHAAKYDDLREKTEGVVISSNKNKLSY